MARSPIATLTRPATISRLPGRSKRRWVSAQNQGFSQLTAQQMLAVHFALNDSIHTQPMAAAGFSVAGFTNLDIDYAGAGVGTASHPVANSADPPTAYAFYPGTSQARATHGSALRYAARSRVTTHGSPCFTSWATRSDSSMAMKISGSERCRRK